MNALFSRITGSLACAMLFLLASNAIGQIHINENPVRQVPDQFGNEYRQTYTNSSVIQLANVYSQYQFRDDFYRDTYGNEYYSFAPYELTNRGLIHEAYVDGGQYWNGNWYQHFSDIINNYGRINHAGVYGGQLTNQDSGSIGTLNSYGGNVTNIGTASIDSLRVEGAGQMHNKNNAYIGALTISSDGSWYGTSYGGTFRGFYYNANSWATNQDNASISSVTIQSGSLENRGSAFIGSVYFMGEGQVDNLGNATIGYAEVGNNGRGVVRNLQNASIDGIDVRNQGSRVENLDNASIGTVRVRDNGEIWNHANANIDSVSIENGGRVHNTESASIGAVSLNGGFVNNRNVASIDNVLVYNGTVNNNDAASIGNVSVYNGTVNNNNVASIDTASVHGGTVFNRVGASIGTISVIGGNGGNNELNLRNEGGTIDTVNVIGDGRVENLSYIGTLSVDGNGRTSNVANRGNARIEDATVTGWGRVNNSDSASISTVSIADSGNVMNNAYIGRANVADFGSLENYDTVASMTVADRGQVRNTSMIHNAMMTGGTVNNAGRIDNLTYTGGTYNGQIDGWGRGSIGMLTVAGEVGSDWGRWDVDHIKFDHNGSGIISVAAFIDDMPMTPMFAGLQATSADLPSSISFTGIKAQSIDLTYGGISLDMTGLGTFADSWEDSFTSLFMDGFSIASLFGADEITGVIGSIEVAWEDKLFSILSDGSLADGWNLSNGLLAWDGTIIAWNDPSVVPEPATLAVLGLGLAGLAIARRRRGK